MKIIAVDPGINASAALLLHEPFESRFLDMVDLRTIPDGENRQLDVDHICDLLERWVPDVAVIENVQPMPSIPGSDGERRSMGAASSFRFGLACGMIRGVVRAYQIEVIMVHPASWKRSFGLKGPDKKQDSAKLLKLYPAAAKFITLQKHNNRSDAGLMAVWYAERRGML